ncbi:MAG: O-antigen polymerase [Polaribacter sp.]|uniref:O-antigen polymerase n=1 Tax=Polaribacter sp. TaxID=1920175 RepID=UPI00326552E4
MVSFKSFFIVIYLTLSFLLFLTFKVSALVWTSFFVNAIVVLGITIYHLYYEKKYSPFLSSYIVFNYLFLLAAPITQINSFDEVVKPKFVNNFPFDESLTIYTNILILVFNVIFIISYILLKKRVKRSNNIVKIYKAHKYEPIVIIILLLIVFMVFSISFSFIKEEFINPNWLKSGETSKSMLLIWKKFLFMIPLTGIIICYNYLNNAKKRRFNFQIICVAFIFFLFFLFWFKNPLTEKRNALGPIYLSLLFLFSPKLISSNLKTLSFLFFAMIIAFPLMAMITHSDATLLEIYNSPLILIKEIKGGGITNAFNTLNYDAFSNISVSIDWVRNYGFSYGYQLLGGLLFFVPRSFWTSKPISSGQLVGEHLVNDYNFNFTNLSNPLISEGFLNFGILGVIIFPIILAYTSIVMYKWLLQNNSLKKVVAFYFAMHLLFLLRGDFTNGFAYFIGPLLAIIYLPKFINSFIRSLTKPSHK